MTKRVLNKTKAQTTTVRGTVTEKQREVIRELIGVLGSNEQDVVGKILTLWIYNEGFLRNVEEKRGGKS